MSLLQSIAGQPLVAILRAPTAERFVEASRVLLEAGIRCHEYTLTSAGACDAIARAREELGDAVVVGAGSVRSLHDAREAMDRGAAFLVSQVTDPAVVEFVRGRGASFIPGALTPNEIWNAWRAGVEAVKVSPIGPVGGVAYFREISAPMPDVKLMPTGGVRLSEVADYLAAGAVAVGLSRDLFRDDLLVDGGLDAMAARARSVVQSLGRPGPAGQHEQENRE